MKLRRGFTLVELLVVIAILATLAGILLPVMARSREKARQTECNSNLRILGMALAMYRNDYDGWNTYGGFGAYRSFLDRDYWWAPYDDHAQPVTGPPGPGYVDGTIDAYVHDPRVFRCPSVPDWQLGYGMNVATIVGANPPFLSPDGAPDDLVEDPAGTLVLLDHNGYPTCAQSNGGGPRTDPLHFPDRHNGGLNGLFYDGHVKWLSRSSVVERRIWSIERD